MAVHPGSPGALVAPNPVPCDEQEGGVGHEVHQVVEPPMRIGYGPTVQLGLDLQYPAPGLGQGPLQLVGVHQRPPGIPVSSLLDLLTPFAMCAPLARPDYYGASAPSRDRQPATSLPTTGLEV